MTDTERPTDLIPSDEGRLERLERIVGIGTQNGLRGEVRGINRAMRELLSELRDERQVRRLRDALTKEETEDWQALQEAWHELHADQAYKGRLWSGFMALAVLAGLLISKLG